MWIVLVHPPWREGSWGRLRFEACPKCGATGTVRLHQAVLRPVRYFRQLPDGERLEHCADRYRCGGCGRTFAEPSPNRLENPRMMPKYLAAEILFFYCFGKSADQIINYLNALGYSISRATIYRFLKTCYDSTLRDIHKQNKSRDRRISRRYHSKDRHLTSDSISYLHRGSTLLPPPDATLPHRFVDKIVEMYRVRILRVYYDANIRLTISWLDECLKSICGGFGTYMLLTYNNRSVLDNDFLYDAPLEDVVKSPLYEHIDNPMEQTSPLIQYLIKCALRGYDADTVSLTGQFSEDSIHEDDIYDIVSRPGRIWAADIPI